MLVLVIDILADAYEARHVLQQIASDLRVSLKYRGLFRREPLVLTNFASDRFRNRDKAKL